MIEYTNYVITRLHRQCVDVDPEQHFNYAKARQTFLLRLFFVVVCPCLLSFSFSMNNTMNFQADVLQLGKWPARKYHWSVYDI